MNNDMEIEKGKKYQWNIHWSKQIAHSDINKVVGELEDIQDTYGEIKPEYIIESSKNKKSVLHGYFEWNDDKAAHAWRLRQATQLLSHIQVKIIKDGEQKLIRAYELSRKGTGSDLTYKNYETLSPDNLKFSVSIVIGDLNRVKNRLLGWNLKEAVIHIDAAIEALTKKDEAKIVSVNKSVAV